MINIGGGNNLTNLYIGNNKVKEVWDGNKKIFPDNKLWIIKEGIILLPEYAYGLYEYYNYYNRNYLVQLRRQYQQGDGYAYLNTPSSNLTQTLNIDRNVYFTGHGRCLSIDTLTNSGIKNIMQPGDRIFSEMIYMKGSISRSIPGANGGCLSFCQPSGDSQHNMLKTTGENSSATSLDLGEWTGNSKGYNIELIRNISYDNKWTRMTTCNIYYYNFEIRIKNMYLEKAN